MTVKTYKKIPVVIEAIQLTGDAHNLDEIYKFMDIKGKGCFQQAGHGIDPYDGLFKITTLEGVHTANLGDYIIRGIAGEFYPCKKNIFEKLYDEFNF